MGPSRAERCSRNACYGRKRGTLQWESREEGLGGSECRMQPATSLPRRATAISIAATTHGVVDALGVNCLRTFPDAGSVVWGSRTLQGADSVASEWKYVPVRRTALFLEESLYRGTQWAVFQPNGSPLWAQIRLTVGAFLDGLFRAGAFAGATPREAYFVKCGAETKQDEINHGIVNILVGFAPLKPAEFVVISLQQIAGQPGVGPSL